MSQATKNLLADALKLPLKSRAMLAEKLLESLEDQEGVATGIEEGEHRWKDYQDGKIKGIPIEDVFPSLAPKERRTQP